MPKNEVTKEVFLKMSVKDVSSAYCGRDEVCRCGCAGDYASTSFRKNPHDYDKVNDKLVEKRLKRAQKMVAEGANFDGGGDTFFDVKTGKDRTLTFYFDVK